MKEKVGEILIWRCTRASMQSQILWINYVFADGSGIDLSPAGVFGFGVTES